MFVSKSNCDKNWLGFVTTESHIGTQYSGKDWGDGEHVYMTVNPYEDLHPWNSEDISM
jgi:hypothetical protein